jgi:hypothetical protein
MRRCAECGRPILETETGWVHVNLGKWAQDPHPAVPEAEAWRLFDPGV